MDHIDVSSLRILAPFANGRMFVVIFLSLILFVPGLGWHSLQSKPGRVKNVKMNIIEDAFRFFTNMNKEAAAKHILMKGKGASEKLKIIKEELQNASNVTEAFSELAQKVSECPSATRGGNLGTFKPGMMVKEIDRVVFEEEIGVVHGPVETQFGSHLILITRRFQGEDKNKVK